jgi:hypothetical protein
LPVSGSTSTSQNWVEKPGAMPPALTEAAAVIGCEIADIAARGLGLAVLPDHALDIDIPDHRRMGAQLVDDLLAGFDDGRGGREGDLRAARVQVSNSAIEQADRQLVGRP